MKIGILGGSFDPLHKEHIKIIDGARDILGMDKVLLMPTFNPPHKSALSTPYEDRVNMLRIFAKTRDFVYVDETEREMKLEKSYAYLVLAEVKQKYPDDELYYIIGSDSLKRFDSWARPEEILKLVSVCVIIRGDDEGVEELARALGERYSGDITVGFRAEEESSSELRFDLELKRFDRLEGRILPEITEYIAGHGLYSKYGKIIQKLKESLSERTYNHSIRTAEFAVKNAWRVWESFDRAFIAGLLHDSAKGRAPLAPIESYPTDSPEVIHQYDGAVVAEKEYGVTDPAVLDAIRYHTTARPDFSALGKLIYMADKLEYGRNYPGVAVLREALERNFDEGFLATLKHGIEYLKAKGVDIDVLTFETYEWYNNIR